MNNKTINLTQILTREELYPTLIEYINVVDILYKNATSDKISAPFIYLIRHSIEIGLKSTILYLCEKSDLNSMCTKEKLKGHELSRLYNCFNQHWQNIIEKYDLKKQGKTLQTILKDTDKFHKELKELIDFFDEYDEESTLFRYGNKNTTQIEQKYSFLKSEYGGTITLIDMAKFIEKYKNSMLVFKYLEDSLAKFFDYIKDNDFYEKL